MTDLKIIPGVGKNMAGHLEALGITCVEDLAGRDPEELYLQDCARFPGQTLDRCCLYVYRLAVAWTEGRCDDPEKQKWWNWTDEKGGKAL
jgi:hypothetical protein